MICNENIHRITKYFLFSVLILFHLSFAQDEIVQRSGDEDEFLQFSASGRSYDWETTRSPESKHQNIGNKYDGAYYKTVFFVVLGIGVAVFVCMLLVCNKVVTVYGETNTSSVTGDHTIHPPNFRATYNRQISNERGITVSYVNSAYSSGPTGRNEVDRSGRNEVGSSGRDRPPDYSMVISNDSIQRNAVFPQVVITHLETPPPKYEDGRPVLR